MEREKRQRIGYVALVVRDYDEAIEYYTTALGFELVEDTALDDEKRWILLAAPGSVETDCSWPRRQRRNRRSESVIRPAAACSFSFTPMTTGETTAR